MVKLNITCTEQQFVDALGSVIEDLDYDKYKELIDADNEYDLNYYAYLLLGYLGECE